MPWCCSLNSPPSDMCHLLLLCFLFLISFAEMENSITERIWFVTVRCLLFRLRLVRMLGGAGIFPPDFSLFFFLRDCADCLCVHVGLSHPNPHHPHPLVLLLKKKGMFSSKKKKRKKRQSGKMTNLSVFVIGIY